VAFFGDRIDFGKRRAAMEALKRAELVVLVGTHCTVDPVLSLATEAKAKGCTIVEINLTPTPVTGFADVSVRGTADEIFAAIGKAMVPDVEWEKLRLRAVGDNPPDVGRCS
jgi:NAD-dependent deacetylase